MRLIIFLIKRIDKVDFCCIVQTGDGMLIKVGKNISRWIPDTDEVIRVKEKAEKLREKANNSLGT